MPSLFHEFIERRFNGKPSRVSVTRAAFTNCNVFLLSRFHLSCLREALSDDSEKDDYAYAKTINSVAQA